MKSDDSLSTFPDPAKVATLYQCIGRCVVQYQRIEGLLKMLLPFMHHAGSDPPPSVNWRRLIDSKATLGLLLGEFAEKCSADERGGFDKYLDALSKQRNDVVHHRFTDPARPLTTNEQMDEAIAELRDRILFAEPFVAALHRLAVTSMSALNGEGAITGVNCTFEFQFVEQDLDAFTSPARGRGRAGGAGEGEQR